MSNKAKNVVILLLLCIIIGVVPLIFIRNSEFGGSDDKAESAISELNPEYQPWASSIIELPGSETETLLFCLQAGLGGGVIGYCFGILKERTKNRKAQEMQDLEK